jgi:hypothetical protein
MNFKKRLRVGILAAAGMFAISGQALAGYGIGKVGAILVGRLGYQVYVQITSASFVSFACGTPSTMWQFAFSTQGQSGRDMLATLLAAKATGTDVQLVGANTCTQDANLEDVMYVVTW